MASPWRHEYLRTQTAALLFGWALLMFLEWGKPGIVSNRFNPLWLLPAVLVSATMTALFGRPAGAGASSSHRTWPWAVLCGLGVGVAGAAVVGSELYGWAAGIAVWACTVVALGSPVSYDRRRED